MQTNQNNADATVQPFLIGEDGPWIPIRDGNHSGRLMHRRHYSKYEYADGRDPRLFVGPGFKLVLMTQNADAIWAWRKFIDDSGQTGINCAIFRNESEMRASDLIRAADEIAFKKWPGERHYTYVDPAKIQHTRQPGRCFIKAGWRYCRDAKGQILKTGSGKIILEIEAPECL